MRSQHSKKTPSSKEKNAPNPPLNGSLDPRICTQHCQWKQSDKRKRLQGPVWDIFTMLTTSHKAAQGQVRVCVCGRDKSYLSFPKFSAFYLCSIDLRGKNDSVIQRRLIFLAKRSREGGNRGQKKKERELLFVGCLLRAGHGAGCFLHITATCTATPEAARPLSPYRAGR